MSEVYQQDYVPSSPQAGEPVPNADMDRFNIGLRQALSVSKEDLKRLLADEKARNADKPKRGPKPRRLE